MGSTPMRMAPFAAMLNRWHTSSDTFQIGETVAKKGKRVRPENLYAIVSVELPFAYRA